MSHNSCMSLSEELRDYYEGRHRSHLRPHSHMREKERKSQEANINLSYFHGKDNVEANLDWEIRVEKNLKRKSTLKSYGSHSYPKKNQGLGILGAAPSKPEEDKGKTIENSQDEATTSPSSSEREEAKWEESSEEIYPQEEGQPLIVKEKCKEVIVSSKRLAKKESHFTIKTNIKETSPLRQPPHCLLCKRTLVSIATLLGLEFIPQVKELLDEDLVRKSLNSCALLVSKIGIIRHQIPKIGGLKNVLNGATLFYKISHAPTIFMNCVRRDSLGTHMAHLSDQGVPMNPKRIKVIPEWPTPPTPLIELVRNHVPSWEDAQEMGVEEKSPEFQEPRDLRFQSSFRAQNFMLFSSSPYIHPLLPPSSYPWPPMVTHLLLEVESPLSLPSPFRYHSSSKKQRNPLMKKILGLQAPMELTSESTLQCWHIEYYTS
ncbi:hypothetical protein HKD37_01G001950 [Glycine soja]